MAEEIVRFLEPDLLNPNPDNPRLIFHEDELNTLTDSISKQGILVPLTIYQDGKKYFLLDGERRWRCSLRLGLSSVPVIIQPKPDYMQNLMMMFAIHNARRDWDPLPTALKLEELENEFVKRHRYTPTETELSGIASIPRGEIRRLKKLLKLPLEYRTELLEELNKPRSSQVLTVDHVIETTNGVEALSKRGLITLNEVEPLRRAIIQKFREKIIDNTVAPRKLINLARAVERSEVSISAAQIAIHKLLKDPNYSIDQAYLETVERADFEHGIEQLSLRLLSKLEELEVRNFLPSDKVSSVFKKLATKLKKYG